MSQFRTIPVQPGLLPPYMLSIRAPGLAAGEFLSYFFPISPTRLQKSYIGLSNYYDTQGQPNTQGITRIVDTYGLAPPLFTIEGTTGWQRHSSDGFLLTGQESILALESFLKLYATLNATQVQNGLPDLYSLELYDFFGVNLWQVEPMGPQGFIQDARRPILTNYRFQWIGVRNLTDAIVLGFDSLSGAFSTPATQATQNLSQDLGSTAANYGPAGGLG